MSRLPIEQNWANSRDMEARLPFTVLAKGECVVYGVPSCFLAALHVFALTPMSSLRSFDYLGIFLSCVSLDVTHVLSYWQVRVAHPVDGC